MDQTELELAQSYFPQILIDEHEPFFPKAIGVTIFRSSAASPSFQREISIHGELDFAVEYAIYWDYDIQHLYDLEHIWVYVAKGGTVIDCEASFHGKFIKALLKDRSNLQGRQVLLYSQAGKHAFSPIKELFQLIPNYMSCTYEEAGCDGLIVTTPFKGVYETNQTINEQVEAYLRRFQFRPSERYKPYKPEADIFMSWDQMHQLIPKRIANQLKHIEQMQRGHL